MHFIRRSNRLSKLERCQFPNYKTAGHKANDKCCDRGTNRSERHVLKHVESTENRIRSMAQMIEVVHHCALHFASFCTASSPITTRSIAADPLPFTTNQSPGFMTP